MNTTTLPLPSSVHTPEQPPARPAPHARAPQPHSPPRARAVPEHPLLALLLGTALAALLLTVLAPVAALLTKSLWNADGSFAGLSHFAAYARTPGVATSLANSLGLSALSATLCVALAYVYAYAVTQSCMPLARWFRAVALIPLLAPSLLMAISLIYLFGSQGLLKGWLLGASAYGPIGIVLGSVLWTFPHALLILCTTLAASDGRLHEAATTLGAGRWRIFRQVTLPASGYGLMISWVVVFVLVITDFGVPKVIGGNTQMLATDIYKQVIGQQNLPMGAVVAMLLLVPAGLAFWAEQHLRARQSATLGVHAVPHVPRPHAPLDRALLLYCGAVALVLLGVMGTAIYASLVSFWPYNLTLSLKNYRFDLMDGGGWASYGNSLRLAFATAVAGALLSFVTAYLVAKPAHFVRARQWLNAIATLPMAVPGLALGLGYILFFNAAWNPLHGLYGGMALLVACTVAHFFSVAHITQLAALQQLDAEYERAAQALGIPFWRMLWRVHLPVCLPTLMQVAGYFFVNAMTTVSAVVFIYAPETQLASIAVLAMDDAGDIAPAAAMATLIFATAATGRLFIGLIDRAQARITQRWRQR
ncbi:putative 2-aminoethylphosphonate ABC transporter permease subunit [Paenacidovorax monticola]|uniref:Putative 2-aminoethylphosphonate ABC transporter permease subunit n=1 Tax=Paenacidovorax monticola TaxID=1926868 RepID=A0A7H0HGF9_9BURK|nr:putative 2-aminoethylphosphonate ABC transporter permease subunit [Paenacidovorax monticola]QNP59625.1 putative 2-aminoethylphosphonate ABC transporter permease subunit [Paenacidovorax monticola]